MDLPLTLFEPDFPHGGGLLAIRRDGEVVTHLENDTSEQLRKDTLSQ